MYSIETHRTLMHGFPNTECSKSEMEYLHRHYNDRDSNHHIQYTTTDNATNTMVQNVSNCDWYMAKQHQDIYIETKI